jgi:hypothetical protein
MLTTLLQDLASRLNVFWLSIVRTVAPLVAGTIIGQLADWGLNLDDSARDNLVLIVTIVASIAYYVIARSLEQLGQRYDIPWLATLGGCLLGLPNPPAYAVIVRDQDARAPPLT